MSNNGVNNDIKDKIKFLQGLWDDAYNYKKDTSFGKKASTFYDFYRGLHFDSNKVKSGKAAIVLNKIGSIIEDEIGTLTDSPPCYDVIARVSEADEFAKDLIAIFNSYIWVRDKMTIKNKKIIRDALISGSGFYRTWCNSKREICNDRILPFCVFPEPGAEDIQKSNYFIEATIAKKINLLEVYGDAAKEIKSNGNITYSFLPDMDKEAAKGIWAGVREIARNFGAGIGQITNYAFSSNAGMNQDFEQCLLLKIWVKDLSKDKFNDRIYPYWRYYVLAEDTLLEDRSWDYPFIPITKVDDYPGNGFWGMGEIEWIESPQYLINKLISQICNYIDLVANPILLTSKNSGIPDNWVNMPGSIARVNVEALQHTRFLQSPPLPQELLILIDRMIRMINDIAGQHASPGTSMRTATQAALFGESQAIRNRSKVQQMEDALVEVAYQWRKYIQKHWVFNQSIRYRDRDGNIQFREWKGNDVIEDLDIFIVAGSSLATSRFLRLQELKGIPGIDTEEFLKALNYPGKEQVLKRIGEKEKMIQEVMLLQQQLTDAVTQNEQLQKQLSSYINQREGGIY